MLCEEVQSWRRKMLGDDVLEALRDPFVQFMVLALLALAAVVVGIVDVNRPRKRLGYRRVIEQPLLSVQRDLEGRVQISFEGQHVHDVRMIILHLRNTGNVPIQKSDYVQPVGFDFGENATVLDAELVRTRPPNMDVSLEPQENVVILKPDVFNGGDTLTLKVLLAGGENVTVQGRVAGVSQIREITGNARAWWDGAVSIGVPTLLTAIAVFVLSSVGVITPESNTFGITFGIWVIILVPTFVYQMRKSNQWWYYP